MKNNRYTNTLTVSRPAESEDENALVQFNARVPNKMKRAIKTAVYASGFDMEVVVQDALRIYFGVQDPLAESRRAVMTQAMRTVTKGHKRPFDPPLIPTNNSATLTSRGDSDNLASARQMRLKFRISRMGS